MKERMAKSIEEIDDFKGKIKYGKKYDCVERVTEKIDSILKKHGCEDLINFTVNEENIKIDEETCGYFIIATNKPKNKLSMKQVLGYYKQEWQVERIFERLKGPLQVIQIYLKDPRHIEAMMYLVVTCAQIFTLIDRDAKKTLAENNERLSGLFPNKVTTKNPKNDNFPNEYIKVIEPSGGREVVSSLLDLKFDYIFFTGSVRVGKIVMEKASKNLIPVTLELGGKSPCIVDKDANIKMSAKRIVWGKFINSGQTCIAPDYLLVHKEVKEELLKALVNEIKIQFGENNM